MSAGEVDGSHGFYITFEGNTVQVASTINSFLHLFGIRGKIPHAANCGQELDFFNFAIYNFFFA